MSVSKPDNKSYMKRGEINMNKRMIHKRLVSLLCTTTVLLSTHAWASQDHSNQIEQRQYAFTQVETLIEQAKDLLDGNDTSWQVLEETSLELTAHSELLLTSFPVGSQEGSKAKESVWSEPEKFQRLLSQMNQGFQELYQGSQQGDVSLVESGLKAAQATCKSCHRSYRSRW
ncbi:cytochrome c [Vibrio tasmaniensis]|uniref:cytochrome c n=1 Tax=Vibrio tasmaniensis TaxID=212663 RepID=UPI00107FC3DD|nr:cytochrome c [Vibrio tasmaniensis]